MTKALIFPVLAIAVMALFSFIERTPSQSITKYIRAHSYGGQAEKTGAPGENNCTYCHAGTVQDGTTENVLLVKDASSQPVSSYFPGQHYTISLSLNSNPIKKGFSSTVLDNLDQMAGSLTGLGLGGTQGFESFGLARDYVSHTTASNTGATTEWSWTWHAPSTNVGDVTFYVATNIANDNGESSGDMIYLSQYVISIDPTAGVAQAKSVQEDFKAGYSSENNTIGISFTSRVADNMYFNLLDLNGKSVYTYDMDRSMIGDNKHFISLPQEIKNGAYVINFFVGNKAMSAKVLVQKQCDLFQALSYETVDLIIELMRQKCTPIKII